jgi:hypothetical protein
MERSLGLEANTNCLSLAPASGYFACFAIQVSIPAISRSCVAKSAQATAVAKDRIIVGLSKMLRANAHS